MIIMPTSQKNTRDLQYKYQQIHCWKCGLFRGFINWKIGGYRILHVHRRASLRFLWLAFFRTLTARVGTVFTTYTGVSTRIPASNNKPACCFFLFCHRFVHERKLYNWTKSTAVMNHPNLPSLNIPEILECQSPCACPDPKITSPRVHDRPDHLKL